MTKDRQLKSLSFCTQILKSNDIENLRKSFIETLSHDLKTPIIAQIRAMELMLDGSFGKFSNEQSEMLQMTLESCQYMYEIVSTLISTYKFDNEEFELNYSYFDIVNTIEENLKNIEKHLKKNNIKVVVIPELDSPVTAGDKIRMQKVIQTLLFNSINSAFKNSIIKIFITENNGLLKVIFENHSGYLPPEKIEKMFRLYTTHNEKYDKIGTGIGLYLVKKIIEKHNGHIIAHSDIRQKNILGFEIPINKPDMILYKNCI